MNNNYFRVTAYNADNDVCIIADSNGYFSAIWEFSAFLISKGFKIIAVGNDTKFSDGNLTRIAATTETFAVRACAMGKPKITNGNVTVNGITYTPNKNS
ncbi:MAG: hypothetical protein K2J83_02435 [Clostridia bacterium]|nr:hypothetical protein [Clostridia bacterium]